MKINALPTRPAWTGVVQLCNCLFFVTECFLIDVSPWGFTLVPDSTVITIIIIIIIIINLWWTENVVPWIILRCHWIVSFHLDNYLTFDKVNHLVYPISCFCIMAQSIVIIFHFLFWYFRIRLCTICTDIAALYKL